MIKFNSDLSSDVIPRVKDCICIPFLKAMEAVDRFIAAVMRCRTDQREPIFGTDSSLNANLNKN